ncbi:hypothetical protein HKX48_001061 [Thoreauomyces humboldtii]|nr:hypothetical protein HKX48_001061 [Thoreauomyces humboldtii]
MLESAGSSTLNALEPASTKSGLQSFVMSFSVILLSEIGDKTFFIAAILAMKNPRLLVFSAAFSALVVMTLLSASLGTIAPLFISKKYTQMCAAVLFLVFGCRMLWDARSMTGKEGQEEMREVAAELDEKDEAETAKVTEGGGVDGQVPTKPSLGMRFKQSFVGLTSPVWVEGFILTFLAEWGDRSQIATIALAGAEDFWWVSVGSMAGHAICSAVAVIGGRMVASRISVKTITVVGGFLFLAFGFLAMREATGIQALTHLRLAAEA